MTDQESSKLRNTKRLGWLKVSVIALAGYVLGSVVPAGHLNYLVRAKFFPQTLVIEEPKFDRSLLRNAEVVTLSELLAAKNDNYPLFKQKYEGKPVKLVGTVQYFLADSSHDKSVVLTLKGPTDYDGAILTFDDASAPGMTDVKKGEPVASTCVVSGASSENVHLNYCELWTGK